MQNKLLTEIYSKIISCLVSSVKNCFILRNTLSKFVVFDADCCTDAEVSVTNSNF